MPDLVHALEAADDTALQVQLIGDAEVEGGVERLVVGREGPRAGAAVERLQYRRLHLEVVARVEELPDVAHHAGPQAEQFPHLGVDGEVGVTLAGAQLGIRQLAVAHTGGVLLAERQRAQRLREQRDALHAHCHLARLGAKQRPRDADHVAQVQQPHELVERVTERVPLEVELDPSGPVGQMAERGLAMGPQGDEPAGQPLLRLVSLSEARQRIARVRRAVKAVRVRRHPPLHELGQLVAPRHLDETRHAALLPKRFK